MIIILSLILRRLFGWPPPFVRIHLDCKGVSILDNSPIDNINRGATYAAQVYRQQAAEFRRRADWCDHEATRPPPFVRIHLDCKGVSILGQ